MKKGELVFIPFPSAGHIVPILEMAKHLVAGDHRLSISILIIKVPGLEPPTKSYMQSLLGSMPVERINFIDLSEAEIVDCTSSSLIELATSFYENLKPYVRSAIKNLIDSFSGQPEAPTLAGFVVDMFCTAMIDVADEFGIPSYVFYASGAGCLRFMAHLESLTATDQNKDFTKYNDEPDAEIIVPGFANPVPAKVFPDVVLDKVNFPLNLGQHRDMRRSKGILVNTFMELESTMIDSLAEDKLFPPIYPLGPIVNLNNTNPIPNHKETNIVTWLDRQPPSSVVFLCFGSLGSLSGEQVKEIAVGLERSGVRFLWSLRKQPQKDHPIIPEEYMDFNEVLPEGFLDRTAEIGKVIGWAPQVTVLAHSSVGGFVSHCGWNSTLESLWFGVPMATWSLFAEQRLNAFMLVKEFRLAVEIKFDYRRGFDEGTTVIVKAEEIAVGIRKLMEPNNDIRKRVKDISEKGKKALLEGGSSYSSMCRFVNVVIDNMP
ncbi:anthocyanidin 3-O-glucosyltransferase 2-like [Humulus lupulus]|uniref:anthocyanidin 3-O-glucosyltransferase 2-like n=1 Tax=Humulus lupulus TaxID=3486 RepID=UPI002B417250|nr:anthocyanidin 3-O-glucosyltransferase 2-like [Humulus lupulus]